MGNRTGMGESQAIFPSRDYHTATKNGAVDSVSATRKAHRMASTFLTTLTPAQRVEMRAKAAAAKAAKQAERDASTLRRDFVDAHHWEQLARALGVRLPQWGERCTPTVMRVFLNRVNRSVTWYYRESGDKTIDDFARMNPTWGARPWAGTVCEMVARENKLTVPDEE